MHSGAFSPSGGARVHTRCFGWTCHGVRVEHGVEAVVASMARDGAVGALGADVGLGAAWARDEAVEALRADVALAVARAHGEAVGALGADVGALATVPWVGTVGV